jgi:putative transposase
MGVLASIDADIVWDALIPWAFRGVLPKRWAVERAFGWLLQSRRLSEDYERPCETGVALNHATMMRLMVRRLAKP